MNQSPITLRCYEPADVRAVIGLFHASVHRAAAADYDPAQLNAWAPAVVDAERWQTRLNTQEVRLAEIDGMLAGFCTWQTDGLLDLLFVHPAYLRRDVATALCSAAEAALRRQGALRVFTEASLTAQPFFRQRGYQLMRHQTVTIRDEKLANALMELPFE